MSTLALFLAVVLIPFHTSFAADAGRSSPATQRPAAPPQVPKSGSPPPAKAVPAPTLPKSPSPDYAVSVAKQDVLPNGRLRVKFRVENLGNKAGAPATIRIRYGSPCPGGENWTGIQNGELAVKGLGAGESAIVPTVYPFITPEDLAGKGCKYLVELRQGSVPWADANPANDRMHLYTKKLSLPDLVVETYPGEKFDAYGKRMHGFLVKNQGEGPAGPSVAWYKFRPGKNKPYEEKKVSVPALAPGQSFKLFGEAPEYDPDVEVGIQVDWKNDVAEQNEKNNHYGNISTVPVP